MLDDSPTLADAESAFMLYMNAAFAIDVEQAPSSARTPFRSCYLKLLQGWGFDSNGPEGAVMKGWVESRFGLRPSYHKHPLPPNDASAWAPYLKEKMDSRFHSQLDLFAARSALRIQPVHFAPLHPPGPHACHALSRAQPARGEPSQSQEPAA